MGGGGGGGEDGVCVTLIKYYESLGTMGIGRERGSGRVKLLSGRWSREWGGGRIGWEGVGRGAEIVEVRCCNGPIEIRSAWDQGVKWEQCL